MRPGAGFSEAKGYLDWENKNDSMSLSGGKAPEPEP